MEHFIVIDMQNDFCTGTLANPKAVEIIPKIKKELEKVVALKNIGEDINIIFTRDTHFGNYLQTNEGKHLPVVHCIKDQPGWCIVPELAEFTDNAIVIDKSHFGYPEWSKYIKFGDKVTICGTVTSICVCSNVSAIKMIENVEVKVLADCCADINEEAHNAALKVMEMQQAEIIRNTK